MTTMIRIPKSSKIKRAKKRILKKQERDEYLRQERFARRKDIGFYRPARAQPLSTIAETRTQLELRRREIESHKSGRRRRSKNTAKEVDSGAIASLDSYIDD